MGLLDSLKALFSGGSQGGDSASRGFFFYLRCERGHPVRVFVNRSHDLAQDYGEGGGAGYALNKVIVCPDCYRQTRVRIGFDIRYREIGREIENGSFISAEEYEATREPTGGES